MLESSYFRVPHTNSLQKVAVVIPSFNYSKLDSRESYRLEVQLQDRGQSSESRIQVLESSCPGLRPSSIHPAAGQRTEFRIQNSSSRIFMSWFETQFYTSNCFLLIYQCYILPPLISLMKATKALFSFRRTCCHTQLSLPSFYWASLVAQLVNTLPATRETCVQSLGWEDSQETGTATDSSILAWRIPWTAQSMGLQRVGHD